jgi:hypothetical protein
MVDIQTFSIAIASAGVFAAAIYYILQIRHQTKMREMDLLLRLNSSMFANKEFLKDLWRVWDLEYQNYDDFNKKYGSLTAIHQKNRDLEDSINVVINNVDTLGLLLKRKAVKIDFLIECYDITNLWEKLKPLVEGWRKDQNAPQLCKWFEYLYNEMKKRKQQLPQKGVKSG